MPYFSLRESLLYYDGHQLFLLDGEKTELSNRTKKTPLYIVTQTCDDGVYFGSRITKNTLAKMNSGKLDVRDAMMNAYNDEYFIFFETYLLPSTQIVQFHLMFGVRVDGFHKSYDSWAIPDSGLYLNELN